MPEIDSSDYHDFVFSKGRLVGEFEQMYRKSKEIPWHQHRDGERLDCALALDLLAHHGPRGEVLEIGCGLGFFAGLVAERLNPGSLVGTDISPTAVAKAAESFPTLRFEVLDIAAPLDAQGWDHRRFDLTIIRGCFWYLFPSIERVVNNLATLTRPGGMVFVAQNFPPLDRPFVGREVLPNPEALEAHFSRHFDVWLSNRLADRRPECTNDNWILFLGTRRPGSA